VAPLRSARATLRKLRSWFTVLPAFGLFGARRVYDVFIGRTVNIYLLGAAIVAGLLFIFIMAYIIYEMFKH
jgi:hypothetical protein